jgi:4a-hydroxytetrahydrobiopterin dehydratase
MPSKLSDLEIRRAMSALPGWTRKGEAISKTYTFARFADGIAFVGKVAPIADEMDHHPDIDVRYTNVTFTLSTHSAGGITQLDLDLAGKIEGEAFAKSE